MKFWCFHFEGYFEDDVPEYAGKGVFCECLVPAGNYQEAEFSFFEALAERKINLIEIEEDFPVDNHPDEMDPEVESNLYWIEWCEEVEMTGEVSFQTFNLYPAAEVVKETGKDA